jgi:hypothetical protein
MFSWLKKNYRKIAYGACVTAGVVAVAVPGAQWVGSAAAIACPLILGAGSAAEARGAAKKVLDIADAVAKSARK